MALVDIFVPCYNAGKFLRKTIESIKAQTYQDYEVVFIDDGSTDDSVEIIKKYALEDSRVRLVQNDRNRGVHYTRNRGLVECHAEYIAFMDADDEMPENRLELQMKYILEHPECDVLSGNYQIQSEDGKRGTIVEFGECDTSQVYAALFFTNVIANGTALIKKSFIVNHKLQYESNFSGIEDYSFWVDCMLAGANMHIMNTVLQYYRVVSTGLSKVNSAPDKVQHRLNCFEVVHTKILEYFDINLTEKEKQIYYKYTNDTHHKDCERWKDFLVVLSMLRKILKQCRIEKNILQKECKKFFKTMYRF